MRKAILFPVVSSFCLLAGLSIRAQYFEDSLLIQSRVWSRDSLRQIRYADWKPFVSHTVAHLKGFTAAGGEKEMDKYGGHTAIRLRATGFFRTDTLNGRWYIIDPLGHPFISAGVTSLRRGNSPSNQEALNNKFGSAENWIRATARELRETGFNTAGSWSDKEMLTLYNKDASLPMPYTTQLNLLSGYVREAVKKDPKRKVLSPLLFITDPGFASYCDKQARQLKSVRNDPNLLGHFSDNEIAFTRSEMKEIKSQSDKPEYLSPPLRDWLEARNTDLKRLTREQEDELLGWFAGIYYQNVAKALREYDPDHLYLGSRLHSTAKNNAWIFRAAEPWVDILSINYYGYWEPEENHLRDWSRWIQKPFFITEFYTKAEDSGLPNISGAGWLVKTQEDRAVHYQNFCLQLLQSRQCVGWHWFRYQDNDPQDPTSDPSNNDSNKGLVNTHYEVYQVLAGKMKELNLNIYRLIHYFDNYRK